MIKRKHTDRNKNVNDIFSKDIIMTNGVLNVAIRAAKIDHESCISLVLTNPTNKLIIASQLINAIYIHKKKPSHNCL